MITFPVEAVKEVHAEMLKPREKVLESEQKLAKWRPPVKRNVNWERLLRSSEEPGTALDGAPAPDICGEEEPKFLTLGLIGEFIAMLIYLMFSPPPRSAERWKVVFIECVVRNAQSSGI